MIVNNWGFDAYAESQSPQGPQPAESQHVKEEGRKQLWKEERKLDDARENDARYSKSFNIKRYGFETHVQMTQIECVIRCVSVF